MKIRIPRWVTVTLFIIAVLAALFGAYTAGRYYARDNSIPLEQWTKDMAEQYSVPYTNANDWGEVIHTYENYSCEAHRWRYRGVYYIGQVGWDCGGLIIEPTQR